MREVLDELNLKKEFSILPFNAKSNVPETPWGEETYKGAKNRVNDCKGSNSRADYYIGIESGLVERYGQVYEEAWACVINSTGKEFFGYSSGLKVPDFIVNEMKTLQTEHWKVMKILQDKYALSRHDTWGNYSHKMIVREVSLSEAIRNALIQTFSPKESLYNK